MWDVLVQQTNVYAQNRLETDALRHHSRMKKWVPVSVSEMKVFIAVVTSIGLNGKADVELYWSTDDVRQIPFYSKVMTRDRFLLILANLHISDNNRAVDDPLSKVRSFPSIIQRTFVDVYHQLWWSHLSLERQASLQSVQPKQAQQVWHKVASSKWVHYWLHHCLWYAWLNIQISYIYDPFGVSENVVVTKFEHIPTTIKIRIILLNYHLTLAYIDAKYFLHIFEIDKMSLVWRVQLWSLIITFIAEDYVLHTSWHKSNRINSSGIRSSSHSFITLYVTANHHQN